MSTPVRVKEVVLKKSSNYIGSNEGLGSNSGI